MAVSAFISCARGPTPAAHGAPPPWQPALACSAPVVRSNRLLGLQTASAMRVRRTREPANPRLLFPLVLEDLDVVVVHLRPAAGLRRRVGVQAGPPLRLPIGSMRSIVHAAGSVSPFGQTLPRARTLPPSSDCTSSFIVYQAFGLPLVVDLDRALRFPAATAAARGAGGCRTAPARSAARRCRRRSSGGGAPSTRTSASMV